MVKFPKIVCSWIDSVKTFRNGHLKHFSKDKIQNLLRQPTFTEYKCATLASVISLNFIRRHLYGDQAHKEPSITE